MLIRKLLKLENKIQAILSDIDGTISDRRHRLHFIEGKKDWDAFFEALVDDPVIQATIDKISELMINNTELILVTGRFERYRSITESWLSKHTPFDDYRLLMRNNKDYRKDVVIKEEMLIEIQKQYSISIVFEDQAEIARMWNRFGLDCKLVNHDQI